MSTTINKKTAKEIRLYKHILEKSKVSYDRLIIFGSQAKGTNSTNSDIDLCVVSKKFGQDRHAERVKLMLLSNDDTIDIEPHPYHPDDLQNKWDPLAVEIQKYGILV